MVSLICVEPHIQKVVHDLELEALKYFSGSIGLDNFFFRVEATNDAILMAKNVKQGGGVFPNRRSFCKTWCFC